MKCFPNDQIHCLWIGDIWKTQKNALGHDTHSIYDIGSQWQAGCRMAIKRTWTWSILFYFFYLQFSVTSMALCESGVVGTYVFVTLAWDYGCFFFLYEIFKKENTKGWVNFQEGHLKLPKDGATSWHGQREMHWSRHGKGQGKTKTHAMRKIPVCLWSSRAIRTGKPLSSVHTFPLVWDTVAATWASASPNSWWRRDRFSPFTPLPHQDSHRHYPTHHSSSPGPLTYARPAGLHPLLSLSCTKTLGCWVTWEWHLTWE